MLYFYVSLCFVFICLLDNNHWRMKFKWNIYKSWPSSNSEDNKLSVFLSHSSHKHNIGVVTKLSLQVEAEHLWWQSFVKTEDADQMFLWSPGPLSVGRGGVEQRAWRSSVTTRQAPATQNCRPACRAGPGSGEANTIQSIMLIKEEARMKEDGAKKKKKGERG